MINEELKEIFSFYDFNNLDYVGKKPISIGHINTTYTLYFDCGYKVKRFLLQQINTNVFKKPDELMENIENVTTFARNKLRALNVINRKNKFMRIVLTKDNDTYVKTSTNNYYRIYHYIEQSTGFDISNNDEIFLNAGKAIGSFISLLADFPIETLHITIKDFHNTPRRLKDFEEVAKANINTAKYKEALEEISFFLLNGDIAFTIHSLIEDKKMPIRVTHNDTKLNNILFDYNDLSYLCLVDLDTIMPGSICYDFGDFIRSACNCALEDEENLDLVNFNEDLFLSFTKGFLLEIKDFITPIELENLTQGAILMCYECGMRFLTDYLNGNIYFKVNYEKQNLNRAKTQIKLTKELLEKKDYLDKCINDIYYTLTKK